MTMNFLVILQTNGNSLDIKFASLMESFLKSLLATTLKLLEKNLSTEENQCLYDTCKWDLQEISDNTAEGIAYADVSGKKKMENPLKFFLNVGRKI